MGIDSKKVFDYDRAIHLDSEDLAEQGIKEGYERLLPELEEYIKSPAKVTETVRQDEAFYSVTANMKTYEIYGDKFSGDESWGMATYVFFFYYK